MQRAIGATAASAMLVTLAPGVAAAEETPPYDRGTDNVCEDVSGPQFPDVGSQNVHSDNIACMAAYELTEGRDDGTYGPQVAVRRDQMASFIARFVEEATGEQLPTGDANRFEDSDTFVSPHRTNINKLAEAEIAGGFTDGNYRPFIAVNRQQMATFIRQAVSYIHDGDALNGSAPPDFLGGTIFNDEPFVTAHRANIRALAGVGIVQGNRAGNYNPTNPVLRDQMASFIMRAFDYVVSDEFPEDDDGEVPAAPAVSSTSPVDGAEDVPVDSDVSATYTQPISEGSVSLVCDEVPVEGQSSIDDDTLTFEPTGLMPFDASCTAEFNASNANGVAAPVTITFTTADAPVVDPDPFEVEVEVSDTTVTAGEDFTVTFTGDTDEVTTVTVAGECVEPATEGLDDADSITVTTLDTAEAGECDVELVVTFSDGTTQDETIEITIVEPEAEEPEATQLVTASVIDSGGNGVVDTGDVWTLTFDESIDTPDSTTTFTVSDAEGVAFVVQCADSTEVEGENITADCELDLTGLLLTVTLTDAPDGDLEYDDLVISDTTATSGDELVEADDVAFEPVVPAGA